MAGPGPALEGARLRREEALPVFANQSISGFGFDPEVLFLSKKFGLRLAEIPVVWNDVPGSRVGNYALTSIMMVADLFRIRFNDLRGRYKKAAALRLEAQAD